jgi:hypothetical protein
MWTLCVVECEVAVKAVERLNNAHVGFEINFLVFDQATQHPAPEPVNDDSQIDKALDHGDIGDVHGLHLIRRFHLQVSQKMGIDLVVKFRFECSACGTKRKIPIFFISVATCLCPTLRLLWVNSSHSMPALVSG